jgi:hypothetical protein
MVGGCRYDSSLGQLTKKFLALINKAENGVLDLNHAAEHLQVCVDRAPLLCRPAAIASRRGHEAVCRKRQPGAARRNRRSVC